MTMGAVDVLVMEVLGTDPILSINYIIKEQ